MKQKLLFVSALLAVWPALKAQTVTSYSLSTTTGTYSPLADATVLSSGANSDFSNKLFDGTGAAASYTEKSGINMGFTFTFGGQKFTHFLVGTNGYVVLRNEGDAAYQVSYDLSYMYNSAVNTVGCFTKTVQATDSTKVGYKIEGTDGKHVLTVEYDNLGAVGGYGYSSDPSAVYSVQYKFYESDGEIQFIFGNTTLNTYSYQEASFFTGLYKDGASSDFIAKTGSWNDDQTNNTDNYTSLSMGQYTGTPANGTTYTWKAPAPCKAPTAQPKGLQLSATSSAVNGSFNKSADADKYLVLISESEPNQDAVPADGVNYNAGDSLGNARVAAFTKDTTFSTADTLKGNTRYFIKVYAANTNCTGGPDYLLDNALAGNVTTAPGAPESLALANADSTSISFNARDNGTNQMLVAYTDKLGTTSWGSTTGEGAFGTPAGKLAAGDEINGGGKVIYVGNSKDNVLLDGLKPGTLYHFKAWSVTDTLYSTPSVAFDAWTATRVPWTANLANLPTSTKPMGWNVGPAHSYAGWVLDQDNSYGSTDHTPFIQNYGFEGDATQGTSTWIETPAIYLANGANRFIFDLRLTGISGYSTSNYLWDDRDSVLIQLTDNGKDYTTVAALGKAGLPAFSDVTTFHKLFSTFNQFSGKKVNIRIAFKLYKQATITLRNFKVEQKPAVDYPIYVHAIDSTIVADRATIDWTAQGDEKSWELQYKKSTDDSWKEAVKQTITEKPYTLNGLDGLTNYDVRVRALSESGEHSAWSEVAQFRSGLSVPFEEVFANEAQDPGWTSKRGKLATPSVLQDGGLWKYSNGFYNKGVGYNTNYGYDSEADDWYLSPLIDLGKGDMSHHVTLKLETDNWGTNAKDYSVYVVVAADGKTFNAADTVLALHNADIVSDSLYTASLANYTGVVRLGVLLSYSGGTLRDWKLVSVGVTSEVPSAIRRVDNSAERRSEIFTLDGQRVNNTSIKALPKGVYIINGKKQLIK